MRNLLVLASTLSFLLLAGCEGPAGAAGTAGADGVDGADAIDGTDGDDGIAGTNGDDGEDGDDGDDGEDGIDGEDGDDGENGENGLGVGIESFHGTDTLALEEFEASGFFLADVTITAATADADGEVTVDYTVADEGGGPVLGLTSVNATIAQLQPAAADIAWNSWVSYVYRVQTVSGSADGDWPNPDGTAADQAYRENSGTLTDHADGSYTYVFATDISDVTTTTGGVDVVYDRSLTHRVALGMGGHNGATGDAHFDFVPDGSTITETRDIVQTETCQQCHGLEFHGHGGDRRSVEYCVTCHTPDSWDPHGGESVDMKEMIHKIHAGGEVATISGEDGIVWDDPGTTDDESADNGEYQIWGYNNNGHEWWNVDFPSVAENCTKCHTGGGVDEDNWKTNPSRAVCGSCHDNVDFADADTEHLGGQQLTDDDCSTCHPATGAASVGGSVEHAHAWMEHTPQNIPEFVIDLTVSDPDNGLYFVAGETPTVSIVINEDGSPIDHTTVVQDTDGKEGCLPTDDPCPTRDGMFDHVYLLVHGPRAARAPVLTTAAHNEIISDGAANWDISGDDSLTVIFDGGQDLFASALEVLQGSCGMDVEDGTFANEAAATPTELAAWLNDDGCFAARGMALLTSGGDLEIRNRNLGRFFSLQLDGDVMDTVFEGDDGVFTVGGYYPRNDLKQFTDPSGNDPKATWNVGNIEYLLDAVDDLQPGTYIASVEITDAGRINGTNYRTPSVAITPFQVGQEDEELPIANNCDSCHQNEDGEGFILDFARHYKMFSEDAIDQCAACHDYQPQGATGDAWGGAKPISKRVHAVHMGANLNYPLYTVDYSGGDPVHGRNWAIDFPQDIRNCETCHGEGTSGTWATTPSRLPCMGCHDSLDAMAHMKLQTWDPSPESPWNGDEEESCDVCH